MWYFYGIFNLIRTAKSFIRTRRMYICLVYFTNYLGKVIVNHVYYIILVWENYAIMFSKYYFNDLLTIVYLFLVTRIYRMYIHCLILFIFLWVYIYSSRAQTL